MKNAVLIITIFFLPVTGYRSQGNTEPNEIKTIQDYYLQFSQYTDHGEYDYLYDELPDSLLEICGARRNW